MQITEMSWGAKLQRMFSAYRTFPRFARLEYMYQIFPSSPAWRLLVGRT